MGRSKSPVIGVSIDSSRFADQVAGRLFDLLERRFGEQLGRVEAFPLLLTVAAICERMGLGQTFVKAEIRSGRLPARKAGDRTVISIEDFEHWVASLRPANGVPRAPRPSSVASSGIKEGRPK